MPRKTATSDRALHFVLQGEGGVGKALGSRMLIEYLTAQSRKVTAVDGDPINHSLAAIDSFKAHTLDLLQDDGKIDLTGFDAVIPMIDESKGDIVIDAGAASFVPLMDYIGQNQLIDMITELGGQVYIHTIVTGGPALRDTMTGYDQLCERFADTARVVVWANSFFGPIEEGGKGFEAFQVYQDNAARTYGLVFLTERQGDLAANDFATMLRGHQTFNEALNDPAFGVMPRRRLSLVKNRIFDQLDVVFDESAEITPVAANIAAE